ncbi:MAG: signal peptidase I [Phycisphaerae bacterium]|nr:signal peptidase I [Phycisphaerae bacterium]
MTEHKTDLESPGGSSAFPTPCRPRWRRRARFLWGEWIKPIVIVVAICTTFRSAVADWNVVPTGSMKPTIVEGDRIVVNKLAYGLRVPVMGWWLAEWSQPQRGEVVVLFEPNTGQRLVKRVIGVPGDTISALNGVLLVNGVAATYSSANEADIEAVTTEDRRTHGFATESLGGTEHAVMRVPFAIRSGDFGPVDVPPGHYFVMGDNREESRDSRAFGCVPRSLIVGRTRHVALSLDPQWWYLPRLDRFWHELR